jgi:hypothetical protein
VLDRAASPTDKEHGHDGGPRTRPACGDPTVSRRDSVSGPLCVPGRGYQGGQLRFPEYGPELYRPAPGAALLFSCSHLHEVLNVTAGRRFVLLSFLFAGEAPRPQ